MLMNSKNRMLSTEMEYYQEIWNIYPPPQKKLNVFQNTVAIFKINSIDFRFFCFIYRASFSFSFSFWFEISINKQMEHKFYTIFLISQMT